MASQYDVAILQANMDCILQYIGTTELNQLLRTTPSIFNTNPALFADRMAQLAAAVGDEFISLLLRWSADCENTTPLDVFSENDFEWFRHLIPKKRIKKTIKVTNGAATFVYDVFHDDTARLSLAKKAVGHISLPAVVYDEDGKPYPVKVLGLMGFHSKSLESVSIPEGVECLCGSLFAFCDALSEVVFPSTLMCLEEIFWNCSPFEEGKAIIKYRGTPEQWKSLIDSYPDRGLMDYTPYNNIVRFVGIDSP